MPHLSCDVLVVGAGPGGCAAALAAARAGAKVVILEKKTQVGLPEQCAGYVSKAIRWHVDLGAGCVAQGVDQLRTFLPDGTCHQVEMPGYILNRGALDRSLARQAVQAGARLLLRARAVEPWEGGVVARVDGEEQWLRANVIIGADGPSSTVARWMGQKAGRQARAFQYIVPLTGRLGVAEVYFAPAFRGGYGWLFPGGETARLGVAVTPGTDGAACLRLLWERLQKGGIVLDSTLGYAAGSVPVGGPRTLVAGNMLLVGDAAGHTHPVTGAGILNAIIAGGMAGEAAARAALEGDLRLLADYDEEVRLALGPALERAVRRRAHLEARWNGSPQELSAAIRRSWVAFPEYYEGD